MKRYQRIATMLLVLCALSVAIRCVAREPDTAAARLILQAGNAQEDEDRLRFLQALQTTPGLGEPLRTETDRLVAAVERWIDYGN